MKLLLSIQIHHPLVQDVLINVGYVHLMMFVSLVLKTVEENYQNVVAQLVPLKTQILEDVGTVTLNVEPVLDPLLTVTHVKLIT
jgi:hypothetical protein